MLWRWYVWSTEPGIGIGSADGEGQHRNTTDNNPSIPFKFNEQNQKLMDEILKRYPPQYKKAAIMPLLDLGQRQHGFCSISVMNEVARLLEVPPMRVYGMRLWWGSGVWSALG
jgi:NADH dehydrogenase (ubiquinone) flavoprotein 2